MRAESLKIGMKLVSKQGYGVRDANQENDLNDLSQSYQGGFRKYHLANTTNSNIIIGRLIFKPFSRQTVKEEKEWRNVGWKRT